MISGNTGHQVRSGPLEKLVGSDTGALNTLERAAYEMNRGPIFFGGFKSLSQHFH